MEEGWPHVGGWGRRGGGRVLKDNLFTFADGRARWGTGHGWGRGSQNWSFFLVVINVWPLNDLKLQPIQSLGAVVSSSTWNHKPDTFFNYVENNPPPSPSPTQSSSRSTDDRTKAALIFSRHLIFYVKKYFGLLNIASWLASNKPLWTRKCNRCS